MVSMGDFHTHMFPNPSISVRTKYLCVNFKATSGAHDHTKVHAEIAYIRPIDSVQS